MSTLRLAYGTNGLTDLRLGDLVVMLSDLGYDGVALTLDHMHFDPLAPGLAFRTRQLADTLDRYGLGVTVETGARYLLDPRRKHHPTLVEADPLARATRVALLETAVQIASDLGAHAVHCFSGVLPEDSTEEEGWKRLRHSFEQILESARRRGTPLAVEPEPGHLLGDLAGFHRLREELGDPAELGLTLDIGHCQCLEPLPPEECVEQSAPWLRHVQIEDMRRGVHEHLPFGQGEIDFPPVLAALAAADYRGLVSVELPRDSHAGPALAERSLNFLREAQR
ncbi:sugar phosphate isomerase/epimerase [Streptomyces sp. P38-E01]|uniref:Sugar phosphate isomerase/epimerase n=1 Tax=Streptomyces tardus TaxID=2780544 RepID=A0A949JI85_9ACTN|nr:sugar phosphate isomerase/epimerase family protein [Streptomyces tardus]MBU7600626.1 sugar phosphate isomerase/epimerase [Streptomyces tardus]